MPGKNRRRDCTLQAVLLLALALALNPGEAGASSLKKGMPAPDFTVRALPGGEISLHDFNGQVVMLMFWASWCSRCKEELEFLKKVKEEYPSLVFITLNVEAEKAQAVDAAKLQQAVDEWQLPFIVAADRGLKVWDLYKISAIPTSLIIGPDGKILHIQKSLYYASPDEIAGALKSALPQKSP